MNHSIDQLLRDVADDLRRQYPSLPGESTEYKIWTQNLSRNPPRSTPLLPNVARIGRPESVRRVYHILQHADSEYQKLFIVMYFKRCGKKLQAEMLGVKVSAMYEKRHQLISYVEGALEVWRLIQPAKINSPDSIDRQMA